MAKDLVGTPQGYDILGIWHRKMENTPGERYKISGSGDARFMFDEEGMSKTSLLGKTGSAQKGDKSSWPALWNCFKREAWISQGIVCANGAGNLHAIFYYDKSKDRRNEKAEEVIANELVKHVFANTSDNSKLVARAGVKKKISRKLGYSITQTLWMRSIRYAINTGNFNGEKILKSLDEKHYFMEVFRDEIKSAVRKKRKSNRKSSKRQARPNTGNKSGSTSKKKQALTTIKVKGHEVSFVDGAKVTEVEVEHCGQMIKLEIDPDKGTLGIRTKLRILILSIFQ